MGLFSSKTVTQVGTTVSRVIEDARVPNSIANGVAKNLLNDDDQMIEHVLDELTNSVGLRAKRMHKFGKTEYVYGLPNSSLRTSAAGKDASIAAISAQEGVTIAPDYYHFAPFNYLHYGWQTLVEAYGYDSSTNQLDALSALNGAPVFLIDMTICLTPATQAALTDGTMEMWGIPPSAGVTSMDPTAQAVLPLLAKVKTFNPIQVDATASHDYIKVDFSWETLQDAAVEGVTIKKMVLQTGTFNMIMPVHDDSAEFHQVRYTINGKAKYWTYEAGSGQHPNIDSVFNTVYAEGGEFFPIVYFRFNKTASNKDKSSLEYKHGKKLCEYINMDFDALCDTIHQNKDIDQVEQAMMTMAVPPDTTNELERRYLFDFFSDIADVQPISKPEQPDNWDGMFTLAKVLKKPIDNGSIIIQDKRFKMALSYASLTRTRQAGKIGKVGTHMSRHEGTGSTDAYVFQRQVSDSVYVEIRVVNLRMTYWIFEQYTTTGDDTDKILLIPVNMNITESYNIPDKEQLYARSMHYVFNSRTIQTIKWYQTGVFAALITIIAIAIAIITYQPEIAAWAAAVATTSITVAMVEAALLAILKFVAVQLAIKLFVKEVGGKAAIIIAVVAAIVAGYNIYQAGGSLANAPWAKDLLQASSNLSSAASKQFRSDFQDLIGEYNDFQHYVDQQTKTLDDAQALLENSMHLDPLIVYGETPTQFYTRTVHSGNIGILGIDVVENYVDLALTLPKLSDTVGDFA